MEPFKEPAAKKSKQHKDFSHHKRGIYCRNRLKYRASRKLTAVKVYSVADESPYLLVFGVPKINLQNEVRNKFKAFGDLLICQNCTDKVVAEGGEIEAFTDCYQIKYSDIQNARKAKKFLDATSFYGNILHITYMPEAESLEETKIKLQTRLQDVGKRTRPVEEPGSCFV